MATAMMMTMSQFQPSTFTSRSLYKHAQTSHNAMSINLCTLEHNISGRLLNLCNSSRRVLRSLSKPISAVGSGLEVSTDPNDNSITIKNAKIIEESRDNDKLQLRVDLTGIDTQKVFDRVLIELARSAPPIPGFRRQKGGKTTKVPKSFLLQVLGEERVTKFVIQEIVSSTMVDYVKKENLNVKDSKINTIQTEKELELSFAPGKEFGFNATLELEISEAETVSP
ncbi:Trigger factor like [Actinidia chinensis var. chinensis]|uniref:peptidylprolyl isomerase n=1 Tax=Actinidia chinensis var. chinensis TaxID=1590841 RepID=A0A2R6RS06_ACTCC|nr:Trigger factor like [Actinidia chinensis var. chinensis]